MNDKQNPYQQIAWVKALNKQGFITCCQLITSIKYYVGKDEKDMSDEEVTWFVKFSYHFLYALQNAPMPNSEKVVFCQDCLKFYQGWKEIVEKDFQ